MDIQIYDDALAFARWTFKEGAQLCPDNKWRYESDMLQASSAGDDDTWVDGTPAKEVPEYTDSEIYQHFLKSKTK